MKTLRIIALQYDMGWEAKIENKETVERMLASAPRADLILLPEMFDTGFTMRPERVAEPAEGDTLKWMQALASKYDALLCGSWPVQEQGNYYNRFFAVKPQGSFAMYDKRYLFAYGGEDKAYRPGKNLELLEYKGWRIQPFICYDLRFPVWMRNTRSADVYLLPANWPSSRISHWSSLLRARAIENQVYVCGVNRVGSAPNGLNYNGGSVIIDYAGKVLTESFDEEKVIYADLSWNALQTYREKYPFLADRDEFEWK